jgi:hypothetical protein
MTSFLGRNAARHFEGLVFSQGDSPTCFMTDAVSQKSSSREIRPPRISISETPRTENFFPVL